MPKPVFIFYLILCFNSTDVNAQTKGFVYADSSILQNNEETQADSGNEVNVTDTVLYQHLITFPRDTVDSWKNEKKFAYAKNLDSLLKLKEEENALQATPQHSSPSFLQRFLSSGIIQLLFWIIAAAVVLFVLYKLVLSKGNFIFRKNAASTMVKEMAEKEHIDDVSDYDALIRQSYKLADYRMAVRYLFLKTLRLLTDKQLLNHAVDKTNFQYVQEITADKKNDFANLVLNYEYVWYGNLNITAEQYAQVEKKYILFNNKI